MVNVEKTIKIFGYNPNELSFKSAKYVVHNCDDCGIERILRKYSTTIRPKAYCMNCRFKGDRNGYKAYLLRGGVPNRYIDGRASKVTICGEIGCNKRITNISKYCKKHFQSRERNNCWKGGVSKICALIRATEKYKIWHRKVLNRDRYTCQECNMVGVRLEVHHLNPFSNILNMFLNKNFKLNPIKNVEELLKLADTYRPFWLLKNGITLCKSCHKSTDNYGKRNT